MRQHQREVRALVWAAPLPFAGPPFKGKPSAAFLLLTTHEAFCTRRSGILLLFVTLGTWFGSGPSWRPLWPHGEAMATEICFLDSPNHLHYSMAKHYAPSLAAVGDFFGFTPRWAADLRSRPGWPPKTAQGYDLGAIARWLRLGAQEKVTLKQQLDEADLIIKRTTGARQALELSKEADQVVDREASRREIMKLLAYVRARLDAQAAEHGMIFPEAIRSRAVAEWNEANRLLCAEMAAMTQPPAEVAT